MLEVSDVIPAPNHLLHNVCIFNNLGSKIVENFIKHSKRVDPVHVFLSLDLH